MNNMFNFDDYLDVNGVNCSYIDSIADILISNNNLSIFQLNISSINAHIIDLTALLSTVKYFFSIIVLCETWLINDFEFNLNGYKTINSVGNFNKGDGVTIFIKDSLNMVQIDKQVLLNYNSMQLIIKVDDLIFSLICTYRSPNDDLDNFIIGLYLFLSQIKNTFLSIFCGDININILKNSNKSNDYLNIIARNGYLTCINNFTRVTNLSGSCIDNIFIKHIKINKVNLYILRCDITDHYATFLMLSNLYTNENIPSYTLKSDMINTSHLDLLIKTENCYSRHQYRWYCYCI